MNNVCIKCNDKKETKLHPLAKKDLCINFNPEKRGCYQLLEEKINYTIQTFLKLKILRGEDQPMSKLTDIEVLKIRELCADGNHSIKEIADKFNTSQSNIHWIKFRKGWKHLD